MNYSQKENGKSVSGLLSGIAKAAIIATAVIWFCSSINPSARKNETAAAEPIIIEVSEQADAAPEPSEQTDTADTEQVVDDRIFINPTDGVLTSSFGERWGRRHNGIDIGADNGTEILAAADGAVTFAGEMSGYGNYVVIDHGNGFETAYGHCSAILVSAGETVKKGSLIAYVGSTGNSTGPHLHFEVKQSGEFQNPLDYVIY